MISSALSSRSSAARLVAGTTCWGVSSALLADMDGRLIDGVALVAFGGGVTLLAIAATRRRVSVASLRRNAAGLSVLGLLEAVNLVLYLGGLRLGPVPVVVALHLTSPILLLLWACVRGRRRFTRSKAVTVVLIGGGITLVAATQPTNGAGSVLAASALALGSAATVAMLITAVVRTTGSIDPDLGASAQLLLAALLTAPLLAVSPPGTGMLLRLALVGALLLAPGFALYWRALRGLTPATAAVIGLNEAIAAALFAGVFLGYRLTPAALAGTALILAAMAAELVSTGDTAAEERALREGEKTL